MKKALPELNEVFASQRNGKIEIWDFFAEEIIEAVNNPNNQHPVYTNIRCWFTRWLEEGATEEFINDLNRALFNVNYKKNVLPPDFGAFETVFPKNAYVAQLDGELDPEAYAADDFSKLLTSGRLKRMKICQMVGCNKYFLGPPQRKWCSKTCGSIYRVNKKRKRDLM